MCEQVANPDPIEHACPECGTDRNIKTQDPPHWHNRWRLIPTLIWFFLLLLLVLYTTPWFQGLLGNPIAFNSRSVDAVHAHLHVLNPPLPAYVLTDYPEEAEEILREGLDQLEMESPNWWKDSQYRFLFHKGHGTAVDSTFTGIGGAWWGIRSQTLLRSVNTQRTVDGSYDYDIETVVSARFGFLDEIEAPPLTRVTARLHGSQLETRFISAVTIIELFIAVGAVWHLVFGLTARVIGRPPRLVYWGVLLILFAGLTYTGITHTKRTHSVISHQHQPAPDSDMTGWYSDTEFHRFFDEQSAREHLLEDLKQFAYSGSPNSVLAYQPRHNHGTEVTEHTGAISEFHPIWIYVYSSYNEELEDGTTVPAPRCGIIPGGFDIRIDPMYSRVTFAYARESDMFSIRVYWARFLALTVVCWLSLRLIRRTSLAILHTVQRARVRRQRCAVCAYPMDLEP